MNSQSLIPTFNGKLDGYEQPLVNARELHTYLQVGTAFHKWIQRRIHDHKFVTNLDFIVTVTNDRNWMGPREVNDYHLSIDMAKELCLLENNPKGREARRYFIGMEKIAREQYVQAMVLREELLRQNDTWGRILRYKTLRLNHTEIARLLGLSPSVIRWHVRRLEQLGYIAPPPDLARKQEQQRKGERTKQLQRQQLALEV